MMMNESKLSNNNFIRVSMDPLYERLLKKPFHDSVSAIEYCRAVCAEFGFTVKQEASANRNIYVYCSREGLPDSLRNPKPSPQRKRPSKRCDCRWRVVLSENDQDQWEFRKSMNPNASEHNHEMMSPDEMVKAWPPEVTSMIIELARQRLQTHEIREAVKHQFPDINWNERRFYNRLTEERKRIRQRGVVERSQRLLLLSARLCAMVANHEDWSQTVENDLQRMLESFCQLARLPNDAIHALVDLEPELIQMETDKLISSTQHQLSISDDESLPSKKRKAPSSNTSKDPQKGIQMVYVPSYTIQVRSSTNRYYQESSSTNEQQPQQPQQQQQQQQQLFSLASPTSSTSTNSYQQQRKLTSPQLQSPNEFMMSSYQDNNQQQHRGGLATSYHLSTNSFPTFTAPTDLSFHSFENDTYNRNSESLKDRQRLQQQQQPQQSNYSLPPMLRSNQDNNSPSNNTEESRWS